jgi:hypothetical protein|tara:strand:+ start:400 stop:816 length:417 start_codon:yes stop_codon:yes gene_type:complete
MAITQAMCTSFKSEILQEGHQLATDTIKVALYTSTASLDATTTAYSSSNEVSGTGYTATGVALTSTTVATSSTTAYFDADDPSWSSATFTARGALIYNSSNSNKAIAVLNFGGDFTVTGGTFKITLPAAGTTAIIRIA